MNTQDFNTLSQKDILTKFNSWKEIQKSFNSVDELKFAIYSFINACPFNPAPISNGVFFRAQKNDDNELFQNESRLWNPPANRVYEMGRANRVGQSMLYLGLGERTALFEQRPKKFEYFTIATFELKENQNLNLLYFSVDNFLNHPMFSKLKNFDRQNFKNHKITKNGQKNIKLLHNLIDEEYSKPVSEDNTLDYLLTIAMTEVFFDLTSTVLDGLIYRSIKSPNDFNYVLRPESAQRALKIKKCNFFQILNINSDNRPTFRILKTTEYIDSINDELVWTDKLSDSLDWYSCGTPYLIETPDYKI